MALDRFEIYGLCLGNLSPSEFLEYLNLDDLQRQIFERGFNAGYSEGYKEYDDLLTADGDTWPTSEEDWDWEVNRRMHSGPGLLNIEHLPESGDDYHPSLIRYNRHYQPEQWNEMNDTLVRGSEKKKRKRKVYEDYNQLFLGISLV